jgi:nitroreductase
MVNQWRLNGFFDSTKLTGLFEAAQRRESCRIFATAPNADQWNELNIAATQLALPGVRITPGICDNSLFQPALGSLFIKFENTQRFAAIIVTDNQPKSLVNAGISGEMFLLRVVEMGLGGCWVSGTYRRGQVGIKMESNEKIVALIALGRPKTLPNLPLARKRRDITALCPDFEKMNSALREMAQYVQIAPSAINLQPWRIRLIDGKTVTISVGMSGQKLELGIAVCHALLALGNTPAMFTLADNGQTATIELL